jgi:CBS domain-containing protein
VDVIDVMTRDVLSVTPDASVREAALLMLDKRISGLPVVEGDRVVGILSEADYVAKDSSRTWISRVLFGQEEATLTGVEKVGELMSRDPITIDVTDSILEAARIMTRRKVKRLPVLDHGLMVGIVTRSDLIRAYIRPDHEIAEDTREMIAVLPDPMSGVQVEVEDGVVRLSGEVETSAEARLVGRVANGVEGVARVDNRLVWEIDSELSDKPWSAFSQEGATP